MRYLLFIMFIVTITFRLLAQDIPGETFGGTDNDIGYTICVSNDGGYFLAGTTRSFGAGSEDMFFIRIDTNGMISWIKTYGWKHADKIRSVIAVDDGFILGGDVWEYGLARTDLYLMKLDKYGNEIWHRQYGTNSRESGFKIISSEDNGYYFLGYTRGYEPRGDIFLVKTDHEGNELWRNTYGSEYDDYGFDLVKENNNDLLIIGSKGGFYDDVHANFKNHDADIYLIKADKDGTEQWQKTFGGNGHDFGQAIVPAADGGFYLFGSSQSSGAGSFDMLLIKINERYEKVWQKTYGGPEYEYGMSLAKNDKGELFLFGTTKSFGLDGSADFYLIKTDSTGESLWDLTIGGNGIELGHQVIATSDGGCIVVGQTDSYGAGAFDFLVTKVDKNGIIDYILNGREFASDKKTLIYPNPLKGNGRIKTKAGIPLENFQLDLISPNNSVIRSLIIYPPDYNFSTGDLPAGLYIYRLTSRKNSKIIYTGKLIIH